MFLSRVETQILSTVSSSGKTNREACKTPPCCSRGIIQICSCIDTNSNNVKHFHIKLIRTPNLHFLVNLTFMTLKTEAF